MKMWRKTGLFKNLNYKGKGPYLKTDIDDEISYSGTKKFIIFVIFLLLILIFLLLYFLDPEGYQGLLQGQIIIHPVTYTISGILCILTIYLLVGAFKNLNVARIFGPGKIKLDKIYLVPGESIEIEYSRKMKRKIKISHLELFLEGKEWIKKRIYDPDTSSNTTIEESGTSYRNLLERKSINLTKSKLDLIAIFNLKVPESINGHSFYGKNNQLSWWLKVKIYSGKKVLDDSKFEIIILPFKE